MTTISEIKRKYRDDDNFWYFSDDFQEKISFKLTPFDEDAFSEMLLECSRQYEYLRNYHPYFDTLCNSYGGRHMSITRTTAFFTELANSSDISFDPTGSKAKATEMEDIANKISAHLAALGQPEIAVAMPPQALTSDQVSIRVQEFENKSEGRIVAAKFVVTPAGSIFLSDIPILVHIKGLYGTESCVQTSAEADKQGLLSVMEGTVLTGEHRGQTMLVETPIFYPDGSYEANQMEVDDQATPSPRLLSDEELVNLVKEDLQELSGQSINLLNATAYAGETDDQNFYMFGDGIPATVDEIDLKHLENYYRLDNGNGGTVADTFVDISSDHPETKELRGMWSRGTSYHSDGTVEPSSEFNITDAVPEYEASRPGL